MRRILSGVSRERMELAVSNWGEEYRAGFEQIVSLIMGESGAVEQLMGIWAEAFMHQGGKEFMDLMVKNGIDGISKEKHGATFM